MTENEDPDVIPLPTAYKPKDGFEALTIKHTAELREEHQSEEFRRILLWNEVRRQAWGFASFVPLSESEAVRLLRED